MHYLREVAEECSGMLIASTSVSPESSGPCRAPVSKTEYDLTQHAENKY